MKTTLRAHAARSAAAVALTTGLALGAAPAAQADTLCPFGWLCVWEDASFHTDGDENSMIRFQQYITDYSPYIYPGTRIGASNTATSIHNNGRFDTAYMYANPTKRDRLFEIPVDRDNWSLWGDHGDNIESGYFRSYH